jgi:hypothetical protein
MLQKGTIGLTIYHQPIYRSKIGLRKNEEMPNHSLHLTVLPLASIGLLSFGNIACPLFLVHRCKTAREIFVMCSYKKCRVAPIKLDTPLT